MPSKLFLHDDQRVNSYETSSSSSGASYELKAESLNDCHLKGLQLFFQIFLMSNIHRKYISKI